MKYVLSIVPAVLIIGAILIFNPALLAGPNGWYVVLALIVVVGGMIGFVWRAFDESDYKENKQ